MNDDNKMTDEKIKTIAESATVDANVINIDGEFLTENVRDFLLFHHLSSREYTIEQMKDMYIEFLEEIEEARDKEERSMNLRCRSGNWIHVGGELINLERYDRILEPKGDTMKLIRWPGAMQKDTAYTITFPSYEDAKKSFDLIVDGLGILVKQIDREPQESEIVTTC